MVSLCNTDLVFSQFQTELLDDFVLLKEDIVCTAPGGRAGGCARGSKLDSGFVPLGFACCLILNIMLGRKWNDQ